MSVHNSATIIGHEKSPFRRCYTVTSDVSVEVRSLYSLGDAVSRLNLSRDILEFGLWPRTTVSTSSSVLTSPQYSTVSFGRFPAFDLTKQIVELMAEKLYETHKLKTDTPKPS